MTVGRTVRIALATDWFLPRLGGIELHVADLAAALGREGHAADVLTATPGAASSPDVRVVPLDVRRVPGLDLALPPSLGRALERALVEGAYDVVHAHVSVVSPVGYGAVIVARRLGLPTVVTFHSMLHASAWALAAADVLLRWRAWPVVVSAVSETVARQARRATGAPVHVLPNGIAPDDWERAPGGAPSGGEPLRIVSTMRLHRKKRPAELLRAFAAVRARTPRAMRLDVFGDGPQRAGLERLAASLGVADAVTLHGRQPRAVIAARYAAAHLFATATTRESFGIAALEARAAGLPVLAMAASGATDFLRHDVNALLAADDRDFQRELLQLVTDPRLRARLGGHAGDVEPFAWPVVARRHVERYADAMRLTDRAPSPARAGGAVAAEPGRA